MVRRALSALVVVVVAAGCNPRFRHANGLAEQGKFVEAAELFEQLYRENPNDPELPGLIEHAHARAVDQALGQARVRRLAGDFPAAQRAFADGLALRARWNVKLSGALESTVEDEREDATLRLRAQVRPLTQKGEALEAQAVVQQHLFLLKHPELAALRTELEAAAANAGKDTCRRLSPTATAASPHWTGLVAAYCEHFGADAPRRWPLVETFDEARATVAVSQLSDALGTSLRGALLDRAYAGPFHSPGGTLKAQLDVGGAVGQSRRERTVQLQAQWVERVPYVEHVTKTFEEKVPVSECEVYEENGVKKTRTVTKEKTKTYQKVVPETRWREVPRAFDYQALQVERVQSFAVRAELYVGGLSAAAAGREAGDTRTGYLHDVVFPAAEVRPVRPDFPPVEGWLAGRGEELVAAFAESMIAGWRARYCRAGTYDLEAAARCARAGVQVPPEAIDVLAASLGADAARAPGLLGRR